MECFTYGENLEALLLHILSTELVIHEIALCKGGQSNNSPDFQRLDCLYACLNAIKIWFDIFLALSPENFTGASIQEFTQMAYCMTALYRLSTFECPEWDRGLVRDVANLSIILELLIAKFPHVKQSAKWEHGPVEHEDPFQTTFRSLSHIKTWWDSKVAAETVRPNTTSMDEVMNEVPVDFLDEAWIQDVLGTGPYRFESFAQ